MTVDETVIQLDTRRDWLYATVDTVTNRLLHVWLFPTRAQTLTETFFEELREKRLVDDALFLVDSAPSLQASLYHRRFRFQHSTRGSGIPSNAPSRY